MYVDSLHMFDNDSFNMMNYKKTALNVCEIKSFDGIVTFTGKKWKRKNFPVPYIVLLSNNTQHINLFPFIETESKDI